MKSIYFSIVAALLISGCTSLQKVANGNESEKTVKTTDFDTQITEKYWKLIFLEGKQVTMSEAQAREVYFILKTKENKILGFAGCNTFNGTYTVKNDQQIRFSPMETTMKSCPNLAFNESEFLKVFKLADRYSIKEDTLRLKQVHRVPLAVFKAMYFN